VRAFSSVDGTLVSASAWAMGEIWVSPAQVLATPRRMVAREQ
jgi:hypothetical protein